MKSIIDEYKKCWRVIRVVGGAVLMTAILLICPLAITVGLHYWLDLGIPPKYESFLAAIVAFVWMIIMAPVIRRIYDKLADWLD